MIPILMAVSVGGAFVLGFTLADRLRKGDAEWMVDELQRLYLDQIRERREGVETVDEDTERRILAEWLAEESARWSDQ